jgi:hypothetical protein
MTLETLLSPVSPETANEPGQFTSESKDRRVNPDSKPLNLPFPDRRKRGHFSSFAVAIALFFAVNFGMSFYTPIDFDPYRFPYQGWAWWTFNDLKASKELHNVALLGSSLMVSAVSCCDANHLNKQLDLTSYHKASYLDDKLTSTFAGKFNTYNLSAPGQMPSDAYLTLKGMLTTAHRPEVVIYGVAPRDFIDSRMSSPTDTEPFRFLNRLVNTDDCVSGLFRDPLGRLEWLINRNLYVSHHAVDFQMLSGDQVNAILDKAAPVPAGVKAYTYWDRTKLMPLYKPGEIHSQAIITQPTSRAQATAEWRDNTVEYIERYRHPDRHTYKTQFYFLRKLAQLCKQEKIELILVNMPIAKDNIAVLKPEAYLKFVFGLQQFALDHKVATYDLNDFNHFDKSDYHDYVHLNAFGAKKLFDNLVNTLKNAPHTNLAMRMAGQELVRQEANQSHYSDNSNTIQPNALQEKLKNTFGKLGDSVDPALQYVPSDLNQHSNPYSSPNSNSTKIGAKTRGAEM